MLLDTHVWLWFIFGSSELAPRLRNRIEEHAQEVLLSPVSAWEAFVLIERKRLAGRSSPGSFVRRALEAAPFRQAPMTHEIAIRSRELRFEHEDPADRFLAATALVCAVPLVTHDTRLLKLDWLRCVEA